MTASDFTTDRVFDSPSAAVQRWNTITTFVCAAMYGVLLVATYASTGNAGAVALLAIAAILNVIVLYKARTMVVRQASLIFAIAMIVRSFAALVFQHLSQGDPFLGSPDAWNYHTWASRLAEAFRRGSIPSITAYNETGRSDVGYYYVLAVFYWLFGISVFIGRIVGGLFGALAAMIVLPVTRRVASDAVAFAAGLIYAVWPMSVGWATNTILRDAFVWFLLLTTIWLAIRLTAHRNVWIWLAFVSVLAMLRYTRPYAAFFLYLGIAVIVMFSLFDRTQWRQWLRRALPVGAGVVAAEIVLIALGAPNVLQMVRLYDISRLFGRSMPTAKVVLPKTSIVPAPSAASQARARTADDADFPSAPVSPMPGELVDLSPRSASLTGNVVRLVYGPFGWTFFLPGHSTWFVYSVWLWYVLIPAAAVGSVVLFRTGGVLERAFVVGTAAYLGVLLTIARGDAYRQREMAVPFLIVIALAGLMMLRNRRAVLLRVYAVWTLVTLAAMIYHIHTLRLRGMTAHLGAVLTVCDVANQDPSSHHDA